MPFYFRPEKDAVFESLKQSMDETVALAYFDEAAPTKVIEDASPVELCALFVQNQNGDWVTLCYASHGSVTDGMRMQVFPHKQEGYLPLFGPVTDIMFASVTEGMKFDLDTDHKQLEEERVVGAIGSPF